MRKVEPEPSTATPPDGASLGAVIFDLDGLLIDTEPLWHEAEVDVYGELGVPLAGLATRSTKGMAAPEVSRYWWARHPWSGPTPEEVAARVADRVERLLVLKGHLHPGAAEVVAAYRRLHLPMALASSSRHRYLELALDHFHFAGSFDVVCSAEDEPYGKPHPGVFLTAAQRLGVEPTRCLVLEDSPAGVLAAKSARMRCLAVPAAEDRDDAAMGLADAVLTSLAEARTKPVD